MATDERGLRTRRKASDVLALVIATCGVGYLPLMPGTFGSLLSVYLFIVLSRVFVGRFLVAAVLVGIVVVTFAGIWAGTRTEALSGRKDPGKVVIDEVAGQLIALLPLTFFISWSRIAVIVSFILFRFFDIVKPYPANQLQELEGGMGIMCDDLIAGAYAGIITAIAMVTVF